MQTQMSKFPALKNELLFPDEWRWRGTEWIPTSAGACVLKSRQGEKRVNTLESLEKAHFLEFCMSLFGLTFAGLAEGVNQKKGPKYENGSAFLKWATKGSF